MIRRVRFVLICALLAVPVTGGPAGAVECVEVAQYKHCFPGGDE